MSTHSTITEAVGPTGNIKIFIDAFNKDFDIKIKSLLDAKQNYKNVYADAIKITTVKQGTWPNDPKVITIGDLFKYTFPDIESPDLIISPPEPNANNAYSGLDAWNGWLNDLKNSKDEKIKTMYSTIKSGIRSNKTLERYQNVKKPGDTNPSLYSPGQYYFDVFMSKMLSTDGPLKEPSEGNGGEDVFGGNIIEGGGWLNGWLKNQGGSVSVSNFDPNDSITKANHDNVNNLLFIGPSIVFGYSAFSQILHSGYANVKISDKVKNITGIDLDLDLQNSQDRPPESWVNLKTQYKTGLLSDFIENGTRPIGTASGEKFIKKDPTFFMNFLYDVSEGGRGQLYDSADKFADPEDIFVSGDVTGYKFKGFYEDILLYKAFVQAGDNYKSVVLPRNVLDDLVLKTVKAEDLKVDFVNIKVETPTSIGEVQFKFNVEKTDMFVVVGGTVTPPLEFVIVANDGVNYILDTPDVFDDIPDDEYQESDYVGADEVAIELSQERGIDEAEYQKNLTSSGNESIVNDEGGTEPLIDADGKPVKDIGVKESIIVVMNALIKEGGLSKEEAAGICGNIKAESGFKYWNVENGGSNIRPGGMGSDRWDKTKAKGTNYAGKNFSGMGLAQWTYGRRYKMEKYVGEWLTKNGIKTAALKNGFFDTNPALHGTDYNQVNKGAGEKLETYLKTVPKLFEAEASFIVYEFKNDYAKIITIMRGGKPGGNAGTLIKNGFFVNKSGGLVSKTVSGFAELVVCNFEVPNYVGSAINGNKKAEYQKMVAERSQLAKDCLATYNAG